MIWAMKNCEIKGFKFLNPSSEDAIGVFEGFQPKKGVMICSKCEVCTDQVVSEIPIEEDYCIYSRRDVLYRL